MKLLLALALVLVGASSAWAVGTITWTCDRCTVTSGSAVGNPPPSLANWVISNLTLAAGVNIITVVVDDGAGNVSSDTITVTFAPSFPGNTLAGAWGFAAGSGTTTVDSSGNSNTATFVNAPTWTSAGRYDNAISFDGINQSLSVADANSLDFTQSFTLSAWVQPSVIHTDYRQVIGKRGNTISDGPQYRLFASVDSATCPATGSGSIAGTVRVNGASGPEFTVCDTPLAAGVWTHIAVTYDGTNLKLYRNGALRATTSATGYMEPSTGILDIGTSQFMETFAGLIDEVRAYNWGIPASAGSNTVFGTSCNRAAELATPSVVGDANCPIVAPASPVSIKIAAAAAGFKIKGTVKFGSQ